MKNKEELIVIELAKDLSVLQEKMSYMEKRIEAINRIVMLKRGNPKEWR